jgi:hypothetical protein
MVKSIKNRQISPKKESPLSSLTISLEKLQENEKLYGKDYLKQQKLSKTIQNYPKL